MLLKDLYQVLFYNVYNKDPIFCYRSRGKIEHRSDIFVNAETLKYFNFDNTAISKQICYLVMIVWVSILVNTDYNNF